MNKQTIKELEDLFEYSSPAELRQSIQEVFFSYLINSKQIFPLEFEKIVEDFYFLIRFLEEANGHMKEGRKLDDRS
jgi:hypothetical protein